MQDKDLLGAVQPEGGRFAIVGIRGDSVRQVFAATREEADEYIADFNSREWDVYYGVAKYGEANNRTKDNVVGLKAFWLDIDCGPNKDYETQGEALSELRRFCSTVGLPRPTLVDSGRGLHVYWPLTEEVNRRQWEHVVKRFREVCRAQELHVDDKVFEVARILRVPDTYNYKDEDPKPVRLLHLSEAISFDEFCDILGVTAPKTPDIKWSESERDKAINSNVRYKFSKIMRRSIRGDGCEQLLYAYNNREKLGYYDWFYALSVAAKCEDAHEAAHKLSSGHDGYDPELVDRKLATIQKATSCAKFRENNPSLCEGCPHAGKILGPLALGKEIKIAKGGIKFAEETDETKPKGIKFVEEGEPEEYEDDEPAETRELPRPYYVGETGGIWAVPPKDAEEAEPVMVYDHNLFVEKLMDDNGHNVVVFRLSLPHGVKKEFSLPLNEVTAADTLRKGLSSKGVVKAGKGFALLMDYVLRCVTDLQYKQKEQMMYQQFGWAANHAKFVIGEQEISADGIGFTPPSKTTERLARYMGPVGTLDKWKEVWKLYGQSGMEPFAFAALSAFGSPLLTFLNQTGAVINLFSPGSGTGKTTVLNMINSVYGHPSELRLQKDDTMNGRLMWVGILNNLPPTMDELTNITGEQLSDFIYALSNGKGKERMMANSNELRENKTTWRSITVATANASFTEKLSIKKGSPEGELMRLIEYPAHKVDALNTEHAKEMFDRQLYENYGHAGSIYASYLVQNLEEVRALCKRIQTKIDRELGLEPKERFWSATGAANIAGGYIAKYLGLIDWDMTRIYRFFCDLVADLRVNSTPPVVGVRHIIGEYINNNIDNILVINGSETRYGGAMPIPKKKPTRHLLIRIEPDTKKMFVLAKSFKEFCVGYQYNYTGTLKQLEKEGKLLARKSVQLAKGTDIHSEPVYCLVLDVSEGFVNVPEDEELETEDAG